MSRAAYMREYRAKRRADHEAYDAAKPAIGAAKTAATMSRLIAENDALREEVRHLKEELAKRPPKGPDMDLAYEAGREDGAAGYIAGLPSFNTRPFTPVPKKGK